MQQRSNAGECIISEDPGYLSRQTGVLADGIDLQPNTVVSQIMTAGAATPYGTPTGNGAITLGQPGPLAQSGDYALVCIRPPANGGAFALQTPQNTFVCEIDVGAGTVQNDHIPIAIADGSADFAVGDKWTIAVAPGAYTAFVPGTNRAVAILFDRVDPASPNRKCMVFARRMTANDQVLVWPLDITAIGKAQAIKDLRARGIEVR